jgi:hypothetical protein
MLSELLPLMTDTVHQLHEPVRDVHARVLYSRRTAHHARVVETPGKILGAASRELLPDATATVWLINHPHALVIGDKLEMPAGDVLSVARLERRRYPGGVLTKAYLS